MSDEKKNRNEILSRIAADLFVKAKGGEELSAKIQRLRDEIKKVIESEDTIFGKIRELVASFEEIIPEEKQRYNAAIKALSTTSKLSRQEIVKAVNNQLEELKILEKGLMPAHGGWSDELKLMEAKSREMRDEISKLREKIGQLESEEKGLLNGMATREKERELVEKAMRELFSDIEAEITYIKEKVEEFTAETAAAQPIPHSDSIKSDIPSEEKEGGEQKSEIRESSAPQDTEWQKKCPMCGGRLNFHSKDEMWQCYSCGYEVIKKDEVQGKSVEKSEHTNAPKPTPASETIFDPPPTLAVPLADMSSNENQEPIKGSIQGLSPSNKQPSTKKKTCPVCRKKMNWYQIEKTWRCPFCDYERSI
jgi:DNA-directed RNA polymerase subunit M/transcription elongation factor TFIIS